MSSVQTPYYCNNCKTKLYAFDVDKYVDKYNQILVHGYIRQSKLSNTNHIPDSIITICFFYYYYFIQQNQMMSLSCKSFNEMALNNKLLLAIKEYGIGNACKYRQIAIPAIIRMRDITLWQLIATDEPVITTYLIGMLQRINLHELKCQSIILSPTKELAIQIQNILNALNKHLKVTHKICFDDEKECLHQLSDTQILISAPTIINNIITKNNLKLNNLKMFIINQTDQILSMKPIVMNMLSNLPSETQLIFSGAKHNKIQIRELSRKFMFNPLEVDIATNIDQTFETFDDMNLNDNILRGIYSYGLEKPSHIQQVGIVPIIKKRDIIAQAQSGTGKTCTYFIGALQRLDANEPQCQVLILTPTRELAQNTHLVCKSLATYLQNFTSTVCVGGTSVRDDIINLNNGKQIVVGTPGRICDMIHRGALNLKKLKLLILDEMDEMLSRGFNEQIIDCYQCISSFINNVQIGVFSATMPDEMLELIVPWMINPAYIFVQQEVCRFEGVMQYYVAVEKEDYKLAMLYDLLDILGNGFKIMVYCSTKRKVVWLLGKSKQDFNVFGIHGDRSGKEKEVSIKNFKSCSTGILITTDIINLTRGFPFLSSELLIINYDLPRNSGNYMCRAHLTTNRYIANSRQKKNKIINFVADDEEQILRDIETFYNIKIAELPMEVADVLCQHPNHAIVLY